MLVGMGKTTVSHCHHIRVRVRVSSRVRVAVRFGSLSVGMYQISGSTSSWLEGYLDVFYCFFTDPPKILNTTGYHNQIFYCRYKSIKV